MSASERKHLINLIKLAQSTTNTSKRERLMERIQDKLVRVGVMA